MKPRLNLLLIWLATLAGMPAQACWRPATLRARLTRPINFTRKANTRTPPRLSNAGPVRLRFARALFQSRQRAVQIQPDWPRHRGVPAGGAVDAPRSGRAGQSPIRPQPGPRPDASRQPMGTLAGRAESERVGVARSGCDLADVSFAGRDATAPGIEAGSSQLCDWRPVAPQLPCARASAGRLPITRRRSTAIVIAREATVRAGPLEESQSAFTANDGAELRVLDRKDDWLQVTDGTSRIGWLRREQALVTPPPDI